MLQPGLRQVDATLQWIGDMKDGISDMAVLAVSSGFFSYPEEAKAANRACAVARTQPLSPVPGLQIGEQRARAFMANQVADIVARLKKEEKGSMEERRDRWLCRGNGCKLG